MWMYTDEQIIEKANEIAKMISETPEVERFKAAEANINGNEKVQKMMKQIKF
ncbi:MAG: YlbF family regulator, partial [Exiguobacterium sp.]